MSEPVRTSSGCRTFTLVLLLAGTLLAGACCVGPAVLGPFALITEDTPKGGNPATTMPPAEPSVVARPATKTAPPPGPDPPIVVRFNADGDFAMETTLDPQDVDPRAAFQRCRRFVFHAQANTAYRAAISGDSALSIRVEPADGGAPIEPFGPFGKRTQLVFIATDTQPYILFVVGAPTDAERRFSVDLHAYDENEPLPEHLKTSTPANLPRIEIAQQVQGKLLVGGAFAPDGKTCWLSTHDLALARRPIGAGRTGSYTLRQRLYALAVDRKGRLYAQPGPPDKTPPALARRTIGDLEVYETLAPQGDNDELPLPARTILVRGLVGRLLTSPDGRWVYFLDVLGCKVGRIDADAGTVDRLIDDIAPGTLAFCRSPDGRRIYTCSDRGRIDVIDTVGFTLERSVALRKGKPFEIAATDRGIVFLLGQELVSGPAEKGNCAVVSLADAKRDKVGVIPVPCEHYGQFLQMAPQQDGVFIAGAGKISACTVPARPALEQMHCRECMTSKVGTPGWMLLSPDGSMMLHDSGALLAVKR